MDVANAILDNLPIVQAAMQAKAARQALALPAKSPEAPATTAPAHWLPAPVPVQTQEQKEAALKEQQRLAQEALQRQATMTKLNDTLKFTDATTQGSEKSPQEIMAEETTNKQLAANGEEAKKPQANGSPASPATQQANKADGPAISAPLALQQAIKPESMAQTTDKKMSPNSQLTSMAASPLEAARTDGAKAMDSKASPTAPTTEDRVRAAKAALNLQ